MCIESKEEHLRTLHHELGHIYYYLTYANQPYLFQDGANPGFHEALGDTLGLSITPAYLRKIGLAASEAGKDSDDLSYLMRVALEKVPALAMSIVVDTWRWKVYAGEIPTDKYNEGWWAQVRKYQGMAPPVPRSEKDFDAGMFYHVSYGVPYDRYFTAGLLEFDFYRALCKAAGHTGELHRCSFYGSPAAGAKLRAAMALGMSKPWPDTLEQLTGSREIDGSALVEYLAPVQAWLKEQNKGRRCGWD
jgi:peptidyl-dipeptidase A